MSTPFLAATLEPGPPIHINGRLYVAASPGIHNTTHDSSAQGSQYCLWPDPITPRNCGPPLRVAVQYKDTLLMRRVLDGKGRLGPLFWASQEGPSLFSAATEAHGIQTLGEVDAQTQRDVGTLSSTMSQLPCDPKDGTLKCEGCAGGCQALSNINSIHTHNTYSIYNTCVPVPLEHQIHTYIQYIHTIHTYMGARCTRASTSASVLPTRGPTGLCRVPPTQTS